MVTHFVPLIKCLKVRGITTFYILGDIFCKVLILVGYGGKFAALKEKPPIVLSKCADPIQRLFSEISVFSVLPTKF